MHAVPACLCPPQVVSAEISNHDGRVFDTFHIQMEEGNKKVSGAGGPCVPIQLRGKCSLLRGVRGLQCGAWRAHPAAWRVRDQLAAWHA